MSVRKSGNPVINSQIANSFFVSNKCLLWCHCQEIKSLTGVTQCIEPLVTLEVRTLIMINIFTARKRSLGQSNVFTCMCHSGVFLGGRGLYDVTSFLAAWSHVPSRGVCLWSHVPFRGGLPDRDPPPCTVKSGQYASYWNAFLSGNRFRYLENYRSANHC